MIAPNQNSLEIGIEHGAQREIDGQRGRRAIPAEEIGHLAGNDGLDVTAAGEGLSYARRIDVELNFIGATAAIEHVALEVRRDVEGEGVGSLVHAAIHFACSDDFGLQKARRIESAGDASGKLRPILVDDGNGRPVQQLGRYGRLGVDRECEHIEDQEQHDVIAAQAAQFLDPELHDVGDAHLSCPAFSAAGRTLRAAPEP